MAEPTGRFIKVHLLSSFGTNTVETNHQKFITDNLSVKINQSDTDSKAETDLSLNAIFNVAYPVGIVIWFAKDLDPNEVYPGTTWTPIVEEHSIRTGSAPMTTGGNDNARLTKNNVPNHNHDIQIKVDNFTYGRVYTENSGSHQHTYVKNWGDGANVGGGRTGTTDYQGYGQTTPAGSHSHTVTINQSHSHTVDIKLNESGSGELFSVLNRSLYLLGWMRVS